MRMCCNSTPSLFFLIELMAPKKSRKQQEEVEKAVDDVKHGMFVRTAAFWFNVLKSTGID